jgi:hypothetical protein
MRQDTDRIKIRRPPRDPRREAIFQAWLASVKPDQLLAETLTHFTARCDAGEVQGFGPEEWSA